MIRENRYRHVGYLISIALYIVQYSTTSVAITSKSVLSTRYSCTYITRDYSILFYRILIMNYCTILIDDIEYQRDDKPMCNVVYRYITMETRYYNTL